MWILAKLEPIIFQLLGLNQCSRFQKNIVANRINQCFSYYLQPNQLVHWDLHVGGGRRFFHDLFLIFNNSNWIWFSFSLPSLPSPPLFFVFLPYVDHFLFFNSSTPSNSKLWDQPHLFGSTFNGLIYIQLKVKYHNFLGKNQKWIYEPLSFPLVWPLP